MPVQLKKWIGYKKMQVVTYIFIHYSNVHPSATDYKKRKYFG